MTDFFSRILARAQGREAQIEPTVAPLFAATDGDTPSQLDTARTTERGASNEAAPRPHGPLPAIEQPEPPVNIQTIHTAATAPPPFVMEPRGRDTDAVDSALSARIDSLLALAGRIRQPLLQETEAGDAPTLTRREVVHRTERIIAREPVASVSAAPLDRAPARPAAAAATPRREAAPVVRRAEIAPVVHPAATADRGDRPPDAPPVVRINIGRIEVRAISSAPPPAAPRPPAPKTMGLDEYLASRDGRGGR